MIAISSIVTEEKAEHRFREAYKCYRGSFRKFWFSHDILKAESSAKSEDEDGDARGLEKEEECYSFFGGRKMEKKTNIVGDQ